MEKRKICVVVTARPSYSRIKTALYAIQNHPNLELLLVVAASALLDRYGSAVKYIEKDCGKDFSDRKWWLDSQQPERKECMDLIQLTDIINVL